MPACMPASVHTLPAPHGMFTTDNMRYLRIEILHLGILPTHTRAHTAWPSWPREHGHAKRAHVELAPRVDDRLLAAKMGVLVKI